ncbi:MAG TPA: hypothetical protein VMG36_03680 [Thermoplasmata archaeon]|nr:hypothetical protein [Thermoplasmata archaeon]
MEIGGCAARDDRLYDLEHEVWWLPLPDGTARLGLVASFAAFAGPFRELAFRPLSGPVERGRSVATIESVRLTGAVRAPVALEVVERNEAVARRPRLLNDAAYDGGWVVRARPLDPAAVAAHLAPLAAVRARWEEEIRARRIRCWPATAEEELIEIGLECSAVLAHLNEALDRRAPGEAILLVTDDLTSPIEMVRWSDRTGGVVLAERREGNLFQFLVAKPAGARPRRPGA